ncbi:MAG: NAD(P)-dependent oxidoreductase [Oligoflexales bacterium]|nr:NAD(P)-dependent oxidoreductase [Oligoflexales bacterium]
MRLLITGITGFLGLRLFEQAKAAGYDVIGIGRNSSIGKSIIAKGGQFIKADLTDESRLREVFPQVDIVCHCAAYSSPWGSFDEHFKANVLGTRYLANLSLERGIKRFIHISSPSIYFQYQHQFDLHEESTLPLNSVNHYAHTKLLAEKEVESIADKGLETITLRPRAIFGPGDQAIVPRIIRANSIGFFPIFFKDDIKIDLTYVDNVVAAILSSIEAESQACNQAYNITNGEPVALNSFLKSLFRNLSMEFKPRYIPFPIGYQAARALEFFYRSFLKAAEPPLTCYTVGLFAFSQTLNITKARKQLGYSPSINVHEGAQRYAKWYTSQQ